MMASPSELSLECKLHSYSMLLKSFRDQTDQTHKLEEFLAHLEEERLKIDAFKRELPLCMQLLTNAMEASRQQLQSYRENQGGSIPVLEEFIPLKNSTSDQGAVKASNVAADKANWMTSAQLWSPGNESTKQQQSSSPKETDTGSFTVMMSTPKLGLLDHNKQRNGGAFLPFSKEPNSCPSPTSLALASSVVHLHKDDNVLMEEKTTSNGGPTLEHAKLGGSSQTDSQSTGTNNNNSTQPHRKARRCWSPDLHRRFVNALQMLGGSQVATPKQIRELMKVDGLTNDEVKSHLQKYRLHTRRPSPSPQAAAAGAPQLVVLGGIWVPPEYATAAAAAAHGGAPGAAAATLYGAHPSSHAMAQEFYAAATQQSPQPLHHHHQAALHHHHHGGHPMYHQFHMYKPPRHSPATHASPDSEAQGGTGDQSESIEDGRSENSSWKADSGGENGGGRKVLALREEGEESNGSEITLKF